MSVCKFYSLISFHSAKSENPFKTAGPQDCSFLSKHPLVLISSCVFFLGFCFSFASVPLSMCFQNVERMSTWVPAALGHDGAGVLPAWCAGLHSARKPCVCSCRDLAATWPTCSEMRGRCLNWQTFECALPWVPHVEKAIHLVKRSNGAPRLF